MFMFHFSTQSTLKKPTLKLVEVNWSLLLRLSIDNDVNLPEKMIKAKKYFVGYKGVSFTWYNTYNVPHWMFMKKNEIKIFCSDRGISFRKSQNEFI